MRVVAMVRRARLTPLIACLLSVLMLVAASAGLAEAPSSSGIRVRQLQRDGSSGRFMRGPIFALVGRRIEYRIRVTNTGRTALTLRLRDPLCDPGTVFGPTQVAPPLNGDVLMPGGKAQYTCSHLLTHPDASPFIDAATVTGQPPSGSAVSVTSRAPADKQSIGRGIKLVRCGARNNTTVRSSPGQKVTVCAAIKRRHSSRRRHARHERKPPPAFTG